MLFSKETGLLETSDGVLLPSKFCLLPVTFKYRDKRIRITRFSMLLLTLLVSLLAASWHSNGERF